VIRDITGLVRPGRRCGGICAARARAVCVHNYAYLMCDPVLGCAREVSALSAPSRGGLRLAATARPLPMCTSGSRRPVRTRNGAGHIAEC